MPNGTVEPNAVNPAPNQHSTCEWVDAAYARRLWAQLLARRFPSRASLLTVRVDADVVALRLNGKRRFAARCFAAGPNHSLDLMLVAYDARGARTSEATLLRITGHAGRRMFQRLRTNSQTDIAITAGLALFALLGDRARWPQAAQQGAETELALPGWGYFHLIADEGVWIAKTFLPEKPGAKANNTNLPDTKEMCP